MSAGNRAIVILDALLDLIACDESFKTASSKQDRDAAAKTIVSQHIEVNSAVIASGLIGKLSSEAYLINTSTPTNEEKLTKLMSKLAVRTESQEPIVVLHHSKRATPSGGSENVTYLCIRVPDVKENEGAQTNLGHYLNFAVSVLGLKAENLKILKDPSCGQDCVLPSEINKFMNRMIQSSRTSTGVYDGDVYAFESGFKGNLPEILAAVRILRQHQEGLRPRPARKGQKPLPHTNPEILREMFNAKSGLKQPNLPVWGISLIKGVLAQAVKSTTKSFPGVWISAVKKRNGVPNSEGIAMKLGYVQVAPSMHKLRSVLDSEVFVDKTTKKVSLVKRDFQKEETTISHGEFRLATLMSLPMIDPTKSEAWKEKLSRNPFDVNGDKTLQYFQKEKEVVDALNTAYAIKVSIGSKDSKSQPSHFAEAKAHLINLTANKVVCDEVGKQYASFKDIPLNAKEYLCKLWHRKATLKRTADEMLDLETERKEKKKAREDHPNSQTDQILESESGMDV